MTLERARRVFLVFGLGLEDIPETTPYDAGIGLEQLPDHLTEKEIRVIAACAACPVPSDSPWYVGDLLNWLQKHEQHAPISRESVKACFFKVGRYTQRTFDNYCSVARTFPLKDRIRGLSFRHHDVLRAKWIPAKARAELFEKALKEKLSPTELARDREIKRRELEQGDSLRDKLRAQATELYRLTGSLEANGDERLGEILVSLEKLGRVAKQFRLSMGGAK